MLTGLDSILLCRQTIGVKAHGVQHVEAFQSFVAAIDIRSDISERMAYMQTCTGRVGEHIQYIVMRLVALVRDFVGGLLVPFRLPFLFNLTKVVFHISF